MEALGTIHFFIGDHSLCMISFDRDNIRADNVTRLNYQYLKKCSNVYFLLHVVWVILLFCQIVLLFDNKCCSDATMVTGCHNSTTMATINRKYIWLPFYYRPLVGNLFEVLRIRHSYNISGTSPDQTRNTMS